MKTILILSALILFGCVDEAKQKQDQLNKQLDSIKKAETIRTDSLLNDFNHNGTLDVLQIPING